LEGCCSLPTHKQQAEPFWAMHFIELWQTLIDCPQRIWRKVLSYVEVLWITVVWSWKQWLKGIEAKLFLFY
jgi:hypothetical protein